MDGAQVGSLGWVGQLLAGRGDMLLMLLAALFAFTSLIKSFLEHGGGPYLLALAERHTAEAARIRAEADLLTLQVTELRRAPTLADRMESLEKQWASFSSDTRGHVSEIRGHIEEAVRRVHNPDHDRRGGSR